MKKKKAAVIFTHIPKTAGYTMHTIFNRQYILKWGTIFYAANVRKMDRFISLPEWFRRNLILLKGHLYFGAHKYIPGPVDHYTMFRDPVKRTISLYNHLYAWPRTIYYKELNEKQYSLDDLFENGFVLHIDNCQVRYLCGVKDIPFNGVTKEHLQMAIDNLVTYYKDGVGIAEYFDESVLMWAKRLNWTTPWYTKQNVNEIKRVTLAELSPGTMKKMKYFNRYDEILYAKAIELFQQNLANAGASFADEVAAFKKENERRQGFTRFVTAIFTRLHYLRFYTGTQKE